MREVKKIVIAGSGTMGCSMGAILAQAGYEVTLYDIVEEALERAKKVIALNWETEVAAGKISQADSEALQAGLKYTTDEQAFADADFVVEAILEKIEVKHSFWEEVSRIVGDDARLVGFRDLVNQPALEEDVADAHRGGHHELPAGPVVRVPAEGSCGLAEDRGAVAAVEVDCERILADGGHRRRHGHRFQGGASLEGPFPYLGHI